MKPFQHFTTLCECMCVLCVLLCVSVVVSLPLRRSPPHTHIHKSHILTWPSLALHRGNSNSTSSSSTSKRETIIRMQLALTMCGARTHVSRGTSHNQTRVQVMQNVGLAYRNMLEVRNPFRMHVFLARSYEHLHGCILLCFSSSAKGLSFNLWASENV